MSSDDSRLQPHHDGATRRLKIALTSFYLPSESKIGVGWMAHRLANALVAAGHDVTMFSPCSESAEADYLHVQVPLDGKLRTFRWAWSMRHIDLSGFDALIAQGDNHLLRRRVTPVHIRTLHGSCFDEARFVHGAKEKLRMALLGITELIAAIRTPHVVGVSAASLRYFPWLHQVIPNGVDGTRFAVRADQPKESSPTILFVGTYEQRKRGRLLVEVFEREVRPAVPDARLWMVCGDAPEHHGVDVLGRLTDDELAERYRRAWLFCLPSTYEGFGVPYVEAMLSGTAVVATSNPGAREVLESGAVGVLTDDAHLGAELIALLTDHPRRDALAAAGLARRSRYDFATVAQQYVDLIHRELN
jgi:phosphatidyl-myo-inositol alpha-mannosyltransferase